MGSENIVVYYESITLSGDTTITGFTLAPGVTKVGKGAFFGCTSLTSLSCLRGFGVT